MQRRGFLQQAGAATAAGTVLGVELRLDDAIRQQIARRKQITDRMRQLLIDKLQVQREPDEIDPDTPLFGTGLTLDSIDAVELVVAVESSFNVQLQDQHGPRIGAMRTLNTLVDLVLEQTEGT